MNTQRNKRKGFTLIEILLVIGILVVLGGVSVGVYSKIKSSSNIKMTKTLVASVADAIEKYQIQMNEYPEELEDLTKVPDDEAKAKTWNEMGPFLRDGIPVDPWGEKIQYEKNEVDDSDPTAKPYKVYSKGPDKTEDTDDDISNIVEDEE